MGNRVKIDFVIMWVDGADPAWQAEKAQYSYKSEMGQALGEERYRDQGLLKYWFRGVERFAPWVNTIFFVTWGHLPAWLNVNHPKLKIVKHSDYILERYLPTFNSNTIELNLMRIPDLSEHFVLFNDDMFLLQPCKETDFFKEELPVDLGVLAVHCPHANNIVQTMCCNDIGIINKHFNKNAVLSEKRTNWYNVRYGIRNLHTLVLSQYASFTGIMQPHACQAFLKSSFDEVWAAEPDVLNETCMRKFRDCRDVNQYLIKEWQLAKNRFVPGSVKFSKAFFIAGEQAEATASEAAQAITQQKAKVVCINDGAMSQQKFDSVKACLATALEAILPDASAFERVV